MCVNLKTFNESFRKWAEEREEEDTISHEEEDSPSKTTDKTLLLADLPREQLIALKPEDRPEN